MTTTLRFPIVGAKYRPPAEAILAALPIGARLILRPEPWNEHDRFAKAVIINVNDLPDSTLAELDGKIGKFGMTIRDLIATPEHHLGYIPAAMAKDLVLTSEIPGTFSVSDNGPRIIVEID